MTDSDILDSGLLAERIGAKGIALGRPLLVLSSTSSTNQDAMVAAAQGAPHGAVFVADTQTQGRGRLGRNWFSPPGLNLYFSIVLRPSCAIERVASLTLVLGAAVADAVCRWIPSELVGIKWPNDVVVRSDRTEPHPAHIRKLAGILVEASARGGGQLDHVVAGIGINVLQQAFDDEIAHLATAIVLHTRERPSRTDVLALVLEAIDRRLVAFEASGLDSMLSELRSRDVTAGQTVKVGEWLGRAEGIQPDGRLCVRFEHDRVEMLNAGEVELSSGACAK